MPTLTAEQFAAKYGQKTISADEFAKRYSQPTQSAAPQQLPEETMGDFGGVSPSFVTPAVDAGIGAYKGAASTGTNIAKLATGAATGNFGPFDDPSIAPEIQKGLTPTNTAQSIGKGAEQVGEFFLPGALGSKAATGAGLLARMGVEGANAATVTAAQGGNPAVGGAVAAAFPVAGAVAKKAAPWIADTMLGAKAKNFATGLDPGEAVIQEGVSGLTGNRYLGAIKTAQSKVMNKLNVVLSRVSSGAVDAEGLVNKPLDAAIQTATAMPEQKAILQGIKQQIADEATQQGWQLDKLSPQQTNLLRQRVNEIVNAAKGDATVPDAIKNALFKVKFGLNDAIDAVAPGAKHLNRTWAGLTEAESAYSAKLNEGKSHFWDYVAMMPAMQHFLHGEPVAGLATMLKGLAVKQALTSPATVGTAARGLATFGKPAVNTAFGKAAAAGAREATQQ